VNRKDATTLIERLFKEFEAERERLELIDDWYRGKQPVPAKPRTATREYQFAQDRSRTPLLGLIVSSLSQASFVDGYRAPRSADEDPGWTIWQANGMDAKQIPIHRGAFAHGQSFVKTLPGQLNGAKMPVVTGHSARSMYAEFQDPALDEWPVHVIEGKPTAGGWHLSLIDDERTWRFGKDSTTGKFEYIDELPHDMGVCPVTRMPNLLDLDGRVMGEVEPFIPVASRIDQTTFDRLMVQRAASWKVRYIAGMAKPDDSISADAKKLELRQDDILIAENPATKFGTLDETPLDGFDKARDSDLILMSVVSQLPPQTFGQVANLSADALALAQSALSRKLGERHTVLGEQHEQWLRLATGWAGFEVDVKAQVKWRDVESRSVAQLADAFGKVAQMLNFPAEILWDKLPFLNQTDVEEAKRLIKSGDSLQQLFDDIDRIDASQLPDADASIA
jgi:hypothetical protein